MNVVTDIIAGPFKYSPKGRLVLSRYAMSGEVALLVVHPETNEPLLTASVSILDADLKPDEICIKAWSENEGCDEALLNAGVVEATDRIIPSGYVTATVYRISGALVPWFDKLPSHVEFKAA